MAETFNMNIGTEFELGPAFDQGYVDLHIALDQKSAKVFYQWVSNGCIDPLMITRGGLVMASEEYKDEIRKIVLESMV